jgi:hypothetical protein
MAFLSVLDEIEELLEFVAEAMAASLALVSHWLLALKVNGKGVEDANGTVHFDVTILALDAAIREAVAVLRSTQNCKRRRVVAE